MEQKHGNSVHIVTHTEEGITLPDITAILVSTQKLIARSGSITTSRMMDLAVAAWIHEQPDLRELGYYKRQNEKVSPGAAKLSAVEA